MNHRQEQILQLIKEHHCLGTKSIQEALGLTRARVHQLIVPLIRKGLVKKEGRARATIYQLSDKRSFEQITRENWELRRRITELKNTLDDRKMIERAKEILIAQFDILPTEAYHKLQDRSMSSGKSMREIAESILSAFE